ncbi:MAG: hypothetical protein ACPKPY_05860 [Nitrososphaeraceae archaeon]
MRKKIQYKSIVTIITTISIIALFMSSKNVNAQTPFDEIPLANIDSNTEVFVLGADFSLDFGGATKIINDQHATFNNNMQLDKDDNNLWLELDCDANDECDSSLSPEQVTIFIVDKTVQDEQVIENSMPILILGSNECSDSETIEDCAEFSFSISDDILLQKYNMVIEIDFDESEWFYINPVSITG